MVWSLRRIKTFDHVFAFLILSAEREAEVLYEVLFDEEFAGGLNIR